MDKAARIKQTAEAMLATAKQEGFPITGDGRVGESDAATLLGYQARTLRTMRQTFGSGPSWYRAGVGAARVSYRLVDLADWIEERRETGL